MAALIPIAAVAAMRFSCSRAMRWTSKLVSAMLSHSFLVFGPRPPKQMPARRVVQKKEITNRNLERSKIGTINPIRPFRTEHVQRAAEWVGPAISHQRHQAG